MPLPFVTEGLGPTSRGGGVAKDQHAGDRGRSGRIRQFAGAVLCVVVLAADYVCFPRHADLTKFDPSAMARLETSMWRHYYEKRYLPLLADLYTVARAE